MSEQVEYHLDDKGLKEAWRGGMITMTRSWNGKYWNVFSETNINSYDIIAVFRLKSLKEKTETI